MTIPISGYGLRLRLIASFTFPTGRTITQFTKENDGFDFPVLQVNDTISGVNGDLATFSTANPIELSVSVLANGVDDQNLAILFENNRAGRGKQPVGDEIIITAIYPDGRSITLNGGVMISGMPGNSMASDGHLKSKTYVFRFENMVVTN